MIKTESKNYDLDRLEKKTASVIYQDGIFDMTLGLVLIVYGVAMFIYDLWPETTVVLILFILYAVLATPLFLIQVFVTKPRLGIVKYTPKRKKKRLGMIIFTAVLFVANVVLFILIANNILQFSGSVYLMAAIFGIVPFIVFVIMAYFLDFNRLYLIGVLFALAVFLMQLFAILGYSLIGRISVMVFGVVIIAIGAVYLFRFLKKYPKVEGDGHEFKEITE